MQSTHEGSFPTAGAGQGFGKQGEVTEPPAAPTCPALVAHREERGFVGQAGQHGAALHDDGLRDHDDSGDHPDDDDAVPGPPGCALEHQRVADGVPAVQGDAAEREHGYGHRHGLGETGRHGRGARRQGTARLQPCASRAARRRRVQVTSMLSKCLSKRKKTLEVY